MTKVASFEVHYTRFLDPDGTLSSSAPAFAHDREALVTMYRAMVLTRTFDAKAVALQRTGRLGTYAACLGQEAVGVGIGTAMAADDLLVPSFREYGAQLLRGVTLTELLLFWGGDERGSDFKVPRQDFPICVPVATHVAHAAGVALAFKLRDERRAVVCGLGDGATSKGDTYEAMNVAGVWRLPVVFVISNNGWAISLPRSAQTAAETLAQKAIASGFRGEQVDGNDVIAVRHAVSEALACARRGEGPHAIEAITYRLSDHTTADDASRYRDDESVGKFWQEEPILRLRRHLTESAGWSKEEEEGLIAGCSAEVERAVAAYLATPPQPVEAMFDYLFAELPADVAAQRAAALEDQRRRG